MVQVPVSKKRVSNKGKKKPAGRGGRGRTEFQLTCPVWEYRAVAEELARTHPDRDLTAEDHLALRATSRIACGTAPEPA